MQLHICSTSNLIYRINVYHVRRHDAISSFFVCVFAVSCLNYLLLDSYSLQLA